MKRVSMVDHPLAKSIAAALLDAGFSDNDRRAIAAIESERARMLSDQSLLARADPPALFDKSKTIADACSVSCSPARARILFALIKAVRPTNVLEIGTNVGISGGYVAAALRGNGSGRLCTVEGSPDRSAVARDMHARIALKNIDYVVGLFDDVLPATLPRIGPIDVAFIDGNHHYEPTVRYFKWVLEHAASAALVVFDDIRWSRTLRLPGKQMAEAWRDVRCHPTVQASIDLGDIGLCLTGHSARPDRVHTPILEPGRGGWTARS
jgi:predicted O-methyltransferase YrrM